MLGYSLGGVVALAAAEADPVLRPHAAWLAAEASRTDPAYLHRLFRSMAGFDLTDAARVRCPSAVVITTRDETVAPEGQRRLAAALGAGGEVSVHEVEGGHGAPIIQPDRFDPALSDAVRSVLGSGR